MKAYRSSTTRGLLFSMLLASATLVNASTWSSLDVLSPGFTYSVNPASAIWYFDGNITPQNPVNIKTVTENQFSLTPGSLSYVSSCDSPTSACTGATGGAIAGTNTYVSDVAFNYLAVHFGRAELLFNWDSAITSFSISDNDLFRGGLSNYRAYSDGGVSAVPLPGAVWLFGSAILGFVGVRRHKL